MRSKLLLFTLLSVLLFSCKTNSPSSTDDDGGNPPPPPPPPTGMDPLEERLVFTFNENSGTSVTETETNTSLTIQEGPGEAERISGIEGNALRVNGYYGWAQGSISAELPTESVAVTAWIAPSSYPVQRKDQDPIEENTVAAAFSNFNEAQSRGLELGINHHGFAIARIGINGNVVELVGDQELPLNAWSFLSLSVDATAGSAFLYVDGVLEATTNLGANTLEWVNNGPVYLGRGGKNKLFINYQTNGLLGAIDGVVVWNRNMTTAEIQTAFSSFSPSTPDLRIPIDQRYADDIHRPKYHLAPDANWTNESHGLFFKDGVYHAFSQRNKSGPYLEHINWAHYTSTDLLQWEEKQQVLWPQPGFDEVGTWAGHVFFDNEEPVIVYTGVDKAKAGIGIATSEAPYDRWTKLAANPVIPSSPAGVSTADFRDPFVFNDNGTDYMMVGTGLRSGTPRGGLLLYRRASAELSNWQYEGVLFEGNPNVDNSGDYWEVPVYYDFGSKSMLLVNRLPNAVPLYWIGDFNGSAFVPDQSIPKQLEPNVQLLAPSIFEDENGQLTAIGIIPDVVSANKHREQGWANVFSLPRTWELVNGELVQKPHPSLNALRSGSQSFSNIDFDGSSSNYLGTASGTQYEIEATIDPGTATKVGFVLNKGGAEQTLVYYNTVARQFVIERSQSSNLPDVPKDDQVGVYTLDAGPIDWRVFVDASVIEIFVNDKVALSTRVFPSSGSEGIDLFAEGGTATLQSMNLYGIAGGGTSSAKKKKGPETLATKAFPNPSAGSFQIQVEVEGDSPKSAVVYIFDMQGKPRKGIYTYLNGREGTFVWDGYFDNGQKAPPGVYLLKGRVGNQWIETKLIVK